MNVGLIGFSQSGKSTLYRAAAKSHRKGDVTAVPVPDARFDAIVAQVKPKKITPATVILHDSIEAAQGGAPRILSQRFLDTARKIDVLLHVVRAFDSPTSPYHDTIDPVRDVDAIEVELVLCDLQIVENRLERLAKAPNAKSPGHQDYLDKHAFEKMIGPLSEGQPLRSLELEEHERLIVKNYQFLSGKPMVVAFNVGEGDAGSPPAEIVRKMEALRAIGTQAFAICAPFEEELSQLDAADQGDFLASMGLTETAGAKTIRAVYDALGLVTFYTAGENETRAWPLRRGSSALKAADTIHSDIARGFIRAEVVHWPDYEAAGSLDAAYHAGKMHLEGKDHVIEDGDLIHIRNKS